jgi:hypothetical protein
VVPIWDGGTRDALNECTMTRRNIVLTVLIFNLLIAALVFAEQTVGLFIYNPAAASEGYTLFSPLQTTSTYLIDNYGRQVHKWESQYIPGLATYLCENGLLLRAGDLAQQQNFESGGRGGVIQELDWSGNEVWRFEYSSDQYLQHHDIMQLPNGNILMIAWEMKTYSQAIEAGRDPALLTYFELWPDHIIEVNPDSNEGTIIWEWHIWDHLIQDHDSTKANYGQVGNAPGLIDLNYTARRQDLQGIPDWTHVNSVDYSPEFDQILLSVPGFCEVWVIDHSTTAAEAAGHTGGNSGRGGDLLYRWGNPEAYRAGTLQDRKLFFQHDAQWIQPGFPGEGNIIVFNNGLDRPGPDYSSVEEIVPPADSLGHYFLQPGASYGPEEQAWIYAAENPSDFYSATFSSAQRFPNGNTLICSGDNGIFFEINPDTEIVWLYVNPILRTGPMMQGDPIPNDPNGGRLNPVYKIRRYGIDFPGFQGHQLIPANPIEIYPHHIADLAIGVLAGSVTLTWQAILHPFALYNIYASADPFGAYYLIDSTRDMMWSGLQSQDHRFFRVTFDITP